jgi:hypothetical protein
MSLLIYLIGAIINGFLCIYFTDVKKEPVKAFSILSIIPLIFLLIHFYLK